MTPFPRDQDAFKDWWKSSVAYDSRLSEYDQDTLYAYQSQKPVAINEYLSDQNLPSDFVLRHYRKALFPQMKKLFGASYREKQFSKAELNQCLQLAVDDMRRILRGAPKTTTPFHVFRALTKPYGSLTSTATVYRGFMSTTTRLDATHMYRSQYGNTLVISVPVGTSCIAIQRYVPRITWQDKIDQCEVVFLDSIRLHVTGYKHIPELEGINALHVDMVDEERPVKRLRRT